MPAHASHQSHLSRLIGRGTAATMAAMLLMLATPADAHRGRGSVGVFIGAPVIRPWVAAPVWSSGYSRRPYIGWWGSALPVAATVVTVGGGSYWYADGWYYRAVPTGGYEVVQPPVDTAGTDRLYVYPTKGQSAELQASDEYECHRWAVEQSGYDPTAAATGAEADSTTASKKPDYARAQAACLTGRGYSVK